MTSSDLLVDLGRGHTRVVTDGVDTRTGRGAGLADPGGPAAAAQVVLSALRRAVGDLPRSPGWRLAVCAPGVVTSPELARAFADGLAAGVHADDSGPGDVLVVSDSAAWHAGAFGHRDGAMVALGTGAVVTVRRNGAISRIDGRGLLLGDVGGGAWIGLHALRAAAVTDGVLHQMADRRFGAPSGWPQLLGTADLAARLAAFVPDVVAAAHDGDEDAARVLDGAAAGVAGTLAALPAELPTAVVGGVADVVGPRLRQACDRNWTDPAGDPIDGLRLLLDEPGPFTGETWHAQPPRERGGRHDTDLLSTEAVAPDTADLDTWPTERIVARLAAGHEIATRAVLAAATPLAHAADLAGLALANRGRLVYVGAGTPGRLAVQDAAELTPTFALSPGRAVVLLAGGRAAGSAAVEGAEDDAAAAATDVDAAGVGPHDVVVGVSASGRTPYVLAALERAAQRGAATVGIANVAGSALADAAEIGIELLTGPEVIAGSTRLAAATAQKIALNTLSTAAMIRAGATYGPWMVDMLTTNDKLRRRAVRIVRDAAGVTDHEAEQILSAADRSVRVALVMALTECDAAAARGLLAQAPSVRAAVERGRR